MVSLSTPAGAVRHVVVVGVNGDVWMRAGDVTAIAVRARLRGHSIVEVARDTVTVTRSGDTATVDSSCSTHSTWWVDACEVDYTITYPKRLSVSVTATNGDVTVDEPGGNVSAHTTNGDVTVDDPAAKVSAHTTNGDVTIRNALSDVDAGSHQGDVSVSLRDNWNGDALALHTTFGDVRLTVSQAFRATANVHLIAGDVSGVNLQPGKARLDASTMFGDIEVERR